MRTALILASGLLVFFGLSIYARLFVEHYSGAVALVTKWKFS